ncbi:MAG: thioredoxin domain-containing protein [Vampirovibrionales bacterium]
MFQRGLIMVLAVVSVVFGISFLTQWALSSRLPSSYDSGLSLQEAVQTSTKPLLIEFYTDTCTTCQGVTPIVHRSVQQHFKDQVTMVMVDTDSPDMAETVEMFGVSAIPALYLLTVNPVNKQEIPFDTLANPLALKRAIEQALKTSPS